jgi:hypothetical protein
MFIYVLYHICNFATNVPRFKRSYGGGLRFPQQVIGIPSASLKRTDVRKISTFEIFLLMRYKTIGSGGGAITSVLDKSQENEYNKYEKCNNIQHLSYE